MTFEEWVNDEYPSLVGGPWPLMRDAWDAATERAAKVCERIEAKQESDNGAANTGGASECAAAIRGQS